MVCIFPDEQRCVDALHSSPWFFSILDTPHRSSGESPLRYMAMARCCMYLPCCLDMGRPRPFPGMSPVAPAPGARLLSCAACMAAVVATEVWRGSAGRVDVLRGGRVVRRSHRPPDHIASHGGASRRPWPQLPARAGASRRRVLAPREGARAEADARALGPHLRPLGPQSALPRCRFAGKRHFSDRRAADAAPRTAPALRRSASHRGRDLRNAFNALECCLLVVCPHRRNHAAQDALYAK